MTQNAYAFTFLLGAFCGAALMAATALVQSERLRKRQVARWFRIWLKENARLGQAQADLAAANAKLEEDHRKHVNAGKQAHRNHRAQVLAKVAEMRAEIEKSRQPELKVAA